MNKQTKLPRMMRVGLLLALVIVTLAACLPGDVVADSSGGLKVWLDQPPTGASIPLAPFTLKAHASDIGGSGVSQVNLLVNDIPLAAVTTDATLPLVYVETEWNPAAPGEYHIQAQAFNAEGWEFSDVAIVCVGDACALPLVIAEATEEGPTLTPTETFTLIPGITPSDTPTPTVTPSPTNTRVPPSRTPTSTATPSVCAMATPVNGGPPNGSSVGDPYPTLTWGYISRDCPVEGFRTDIATDAAFTSIVESGGTGNPSTSWAPANALADCTTYYWRIAGVIGSTLGPYSAPTSFNTAFPDGCGAPSDTTLPALTVRVTPNPAAYGQYCSEKVATVNVLVVASDESGIASVVTEYRYMNVNQDQKGDWHGVAMTPGSTNSWNGFFINNNLSEIYTVLGRSSTGYIRVRVTVTDNADNSTQQDTDVSLTAPCIG